MTSVLFTNVRIFDGTGALAYPGEILVHGISPFHKDSHQGAGARAIPPVRRVRTGGSSA